MNLRKLRLAAVLSQKEVAQHVGINRAILSAIETELVLPTSRLAGRIQTAILILEKSDWGCLAEQQRATK